MSDEHEEPAKDLSPGNNAAADNISRQVTPYASDIPDSRDEDIREKIDEDRTRGSCGKCRTGHSRVSGAKQ